MTTPYPKRRVVPFVPRKPEGTHMVRIGATIRPDQHAQFVALGGSKWLRKALDAAVL